MRTSRFCQYVYLVAFAALAGPLPAQELPTRTIEQTYTFDDRGDAVVETSSQFSAAEWVEWKERFGDHPDLLLRDLRYQYASAVVDDYSLEKDDVHRHATAKIKARALARYRSNGDFAIDVTKDLKLVTGSGSDWFFTSSAAMNGVLINQTLKAKLPAKATRVAFTPGGDFNLLTYSIDVTPLRSKGSLIVGICLLLLGVGAAIASFFVMQRHTTTVTIIPPPPSAPPPIPNLPKQ
ncbi:MAG: hypothetical protein ABJF10_27520 [Chthoniobacter sp.]|uniref:hypothetical protein n=1 Tax=Chthoniobacter sp. TaxID=2510640 RepID=UPI0032A99318